MGSREKEMRYVCIYVCLCKGNEDQKCAKVGKKSTLGKKGIRLGKTHIYIQCGVCMLGRFRRV